MQDLIAQERFEIEVLDGLNSGRFLNHLVLGGGTMLRLCYQLDRFSVDLDFWITQAVDTKKLYQELEKHFSSLYRLTDSADKFHTLLFELKSGRYPRSLKIEIRKEPKKIQTSQAIAHSMHSDTQVLVRAVTLEEMMRSKVEAFLDRREIRDVFDMEFLMKRGIALDAPLETLQKLLKTMEGLSKEDYKSKLGYLLEEKKRKYYTKENFKILKMAILEKLSPA